MSRPDDDRDRVSRLGTARVPDDSDAGELFRRGWWAIALRGLFAIVLGFVILTRPGMTMAFFIAMLGIYLFADGVFTVAAALSAAHEKKRWAAYMLEGMLSMAAGVLALARPTSAALFIVLLIAVRAIVVGAVEIGTGISVRRATGTSPWLLWLGGLASLVFGLLLFGNPGVGLLALVWMVGIYAIIFGVLIDAEAFRMRGASGHHLRTRTA